MFNNIKYLKRNLKSLIKPVLQSIDAPFQKRDWKQFYLHTSLY